LCENLWNVEAYPDRHEKIQEMGYDGNRLLRELENRIGKIVSKHARPSGFKEEPTKIRLRQKISF